MLTMFSFFFRRQSVSCRQLYELEKNFVLNFRPYGPFFQADQSNERCLDLRFQVGLQEAICCPQLHEDIFSSRVCCTALPDVPPNTHTHLNTTGISNGRIIIKLKTSCVLLATIQQRSDLRGQFSVQPIISTNC